MTLELITKDNQPIQSLVIDSSQRIANTGLVVSVGINGVTKIEAYNEFAGPDYVLWFAVYVGERIIKRVNSRFVVEVGYGIN